MKVVTVHRGARDNYQVARALQEAGLLETLVTDLYWPGEQGWAHRVEGVSPLGVANALRCRHAGGVPSSSVKACWTSGLSSFAVSKVKQLPFSWNSRATRWCDASLGDAASKIAAKKNAALLSYSYYAHSAFSGNTGDRPRILFQLHPHPASVRTILRNELRINPDCKSSLEKEWELALPEEDFRRLNEEVKMAQHWIVASNFTKKTLVQEGVPAPAVKVVPYGIDLNSYTSTKKPRSPGEPLRLLFVGTLGQRKGIKYLVQALELLPVSSVELTMCGRAVDDLKLLKESRIPIKIFPSISAQGLRDQYNHADVFVFPSLAEGFAQVLLEAMASGLPIIGTTSTAAPDLIEHGREGFIISPGNASELAFSIQEFLRRPELISSMGEAARTRAQYFSWQRFRYGVAEFVREILTRPREASAADLCLSH